MDNATLPVTPRPEPGQRPPINWWGTIPIWIIHVLPFLAFLTGVPWWNWVLLAATYWGRMFFITAGYHRYFAHRSFKTNRVVQFILAFGAGTAAQKGPLWWAGNHRLHHRYSDTDRDPHTPIKGFWWSHIGWILSSEYDPTPTEAIEDFAKYPELRFLNNHDWIAPWTLGAVCAIVGGWSGLLIGFFLSTVLLWHSTFMVNSVVHVVGTRRYVTNDTSRNNAAVAFLTMGEGWHNNHHYYPASARQGFFWWEFDASWYVLRTMAALHLVSDLKVPSAEVLKANRIRQGNLDIGMLREQLRQARVVIDDSRVPVLDLGDPELDIAKTRLEDALYEMAASAEDVARRDRKRRQALARAAVESAETTSR